MLKEETRVGVQADKSGAIDETTELSITAHYMYVCMPNSHPSMYT